MSDGDERAAIDPALRARIGVNALASARLAAGASVLPIGWYKDFGFLGRAHLDREDDAAIGYVPILTWQSRYDVWWKRLGMAGLFLKGDIPHPPGATLSDFQDAISLSRLEQRIRREEASLGSGTLFLVGIEPGYRPNGDSRSPEEIIADAEKLRAMLDRIGRGYRLGLGGISTTRNANTRAGYGGVFGLEFLEQILAVPRDFSFDAFVAHPYPSEPTHPSARDSKQQIIEFRELLARHGLADREVLVGEVGAPFAGASTADVAAFAQEIVHFMLTARDAEIGNPRDDGRLVQRFAWMLLAPLERHVPGFSDNPGLDFEVSTLIDRAGKRTPAGAALARAVSEMH